MENECVKQQHGGRREGAGRPKSGKRRGGAHRKRPPLSKDHAVHVTLRTKSSVPKLRQRKMYEAIRRGLLRVVDRPDFRLIHTSIQRTHLHLIIEADNELALTKGMQSLAICVARAINATVGRSGKVFAFRYHARQIRDASYARNALAYVLNNWRRHREDWINGQLAASTLDPYSTACSFDGWFGQRTMKRPEGYEPLPYAKPTTRLLSSEWRWFGKIDVFERPGPLC